MAKMDVILTAVLHDGKTTKQPGETVSMEKDQAERLAGLGMVKLSKAAKAKNGKTAGKQQTPPPPPPEGDQDDDPNGDTDDGGSTDDQENGEE